MIRVCDKILELRGQPDKQAVFAEKWEGMGGHEHVVRVEFQLRRNSIRRLLGDGRIDTVEDYFREKAVIWAYLTREWFRLTDEPVDAKNRNQDRAKTWPVWEVVQRAMGDDALPARRLERIGKADVSAWVAQGISCLMKAGVEWGCHIDGFMDFLRMAARMCQDWSDGDEDKLLKLWDRFRVEREQRVMQVPKGRPPCPSA